MVRNLKKTDQVAELNLNGLKEMRADYCLEQAVEAIEAMEVEDNMDLSSAESK